MIRRAGPLGLAAAVVIAGPAVAQSMPGMAGMDHPSAITTGARQPSTSVPAGTEPAPHRNQGQAAMPPMVGMSPSNGGVPPVQAGVAIAGTALPAGDAPPPPVPDDFYADRTYPAADDAQARAVMMHQQGGQTFYQLLFNLAEYQAHAGRDSYRWDGEAWFGGDIDRVTLRTEGEGTRGAGVDSAEVQLLYSRAIGPYFNLQGGLRQDAAPTPVRTYVTVGVEGLAPYMFQTEARLFVATNGEVLARLEGWYDQRLTQRLVLQPRVELNLAAQSDRRTRIGAGLTDAELGLRLRYEVSRQFAPYLGVSYEATTGRTADFRLTDGKAPTTTSFVGGVRFWL